MTMPRSDAADLAAIRGRLAGARALWRSLEELADTRRSRTTSAANSPHRGETGSTPSAAASSSS